MKTIRFFLFNRFTKIQIESFEHYMGSNKRAMAAGLEFVYMFSIQALFLIPFMLLAFLVDKLSGNDTYGSAVFFGPIVGITLNKDLYGQSVIHRRFGYQVRDKKTNHTADPLKCALRNFTFFLWPIEVLFFFFSPKRRLGDYLAGTVLVEVPVSNPELILQDIQTKRWNSQMTLSLVLATLWTVIYTLIRF